jgi:hypothetical protein
MYSNTEYKKLISKYGAFASWAIWDYKKPFDTGIIDKNYDQLHSKYVLLGLNFSHKLTGNNWQNFHDNTHARKIKYACNATKLRGSYITDIFKGIPEAKSSNLKNKLTKETINANVNYFIKEMKDIKLSNKSQFIVFGTPSSFLAKSFNTYFRPHFKNNVLCYYHYAYYSLTDKNWVRGFWKRLSINKDVDLAINKYKA